MATVVTFGNQKGGVGKTTLTNQFAMYIHNKTEYSVAVIDGDYLQESLSNARKNEKKSYLESQKNEVLVKNGVWSEKLENAISERYENLCYPLKTRNMSNIFDTIVQLYDEYDFILLDMPGSLIGDGIILAYTLIDYLFVPLDITPKDMDSTKLFLDMYNIHVKPKREAKKLAVNVYGVLNKVREGSIELKNKHEKLTEKEITIPFLNNYITAIDQLKRDDSTAAMLTLEKIKNPEMIDNFCKEIIDLIINHKN